MFGDWVYQAQFTDVMNNNKGYGWKPVKIPNIPFDKDCFIEPIPITPKILEQNGFTRSNAFVEWKYEEDGVYILWKPFPWIKIQSEECSVMFPCEFVHELQHALNLCNIKKEINL